jgi:hypothetical protein
MVQVNEVSEPISTVSTSGNVKTVDEALRTGDWKNHLEKIALHARSNCKKRAGLLIVRPGQLAISANAQAAELRCEYFKADRLISCLLAEDDEVNDKSGKKRTKRPKFLESIVDAAEANKVARALLEMKNSGIPRYMCQTLKPEKKKGDVPDVLFMGTGKNDIPGDWVETKGHSKGDKSDASYYVWLWEGDQTMSNFMTGVLVVIFLLVTCFPIWPDILKLILWYISCTALVVIILTIIIRWFLFLFVWVFGYEFWLLPNLFDEERSVVDSFKPLMSFEKTGPGQFVWRLAVLGGFVGFCYWAYTQPTEFDDFLKSNRQFVDDLYEGNLLSDTSQLARDNIDNPYKVPTIEDLLSDVEHDAPPATATEDRVENANFLDVEENAETDVDAMLNSLFDGEADSVN